ncbi:PREDICTED: uncharacterized protein LOC109244718 [Nicotiana attenuata]|uniref:uncharacterized protein LOC109244718 n=1 Tax=Nicotiana attenuata TaxID=49451 RepID=UPI000904A959|nr:PREDICTED: uncharacterized protein LOC109244718 [Nicotiana attenuata]
MRLIGFPERFITWVMECVKTVDYTIMVNGEPTDPFNVEKGLRQGDPMSPFLFAIAMEYLSRTLKEMAERKQCLRIASKHRENFHLFWRGGTTRPRADTANTGIYKRNFKYLGAPLSTRKLTMIQWKPLIEKIVARTTSWTAKKLSYAGRSQLISSVLFGVQSYWAQLFILPTKVMKSVKSFCRSYLWTGNNVITKKALISWEGVCCPKSSARWNLINMRIWNKAAIIKLYRNLAKKENRMWIRWIHAYYIKGQQMEQVKVPQQASWMVRKIIEAKHLLEQNNVHICREKGFIKHIYLQLLGDQPRMQWKCLMFGNATRPKAKFTVWLQMQNMLLTADRLNK